jgi:hypothetical protein
MRFPAKDRRVLLATPGIGPRVLDRLEEAGFNSIAMLLEHRIEDVIAQVHRRVPDTLLENRRRALQRGLAAWCLLSSRQAPAGPVGT